MVDQKGKKIYWTPRHGRFPTIGQPKPKLKALDPTTFARSLKITDAQKNVTMQAERRPFNRNLLVPPFTPSKEYRILFPIAYPTHFDWRREDHTKFETNMKDAIKSAFNEIDSIIDWYRPNTMIREWRDIISNDPLNYNKDWRFVPIYGQYCQAIFNSIREKIKSMQWFTTDLFSSPKRLIALADAHITEAKFIVAGIGFEVAKQVFDKAGGKAFVTIRMDKMIDKNAFLSAVNDGVKAVGNTPISHFTSMVSKDGLSNVVFEKVAYDVMFKEEEVVGLIMNHQQRLKVDPILSIDILNNPIVGAACSLAGLGTYHAIATMGIKILNAPLHWLEAMELMAEAKGHMDFLIAEDKRGLRQGKGHSFEEKVRMDAVVEDLDNLYVGGDYEGIIHNLQALYSVFCKDNRSLLQIKKSYSFPPDEEHWTEKVEKSLSDAWDELWEDVQVVDGQKYYLNKSTGTWEPWESRPRK